MLFYPFVFIFCSAVSIANQEVYYHLNQNSNGPIISGSNSMFGPSQIAPSNHYQMIQLGNHYHKLWGDELAQKAKIDSKGQLDESIQKYKKIFDSMSSTASFQTQSHDLKDQIAEVHKALEDAQPTFQKQKNAKELGLITIQEAQIEYLLHEEQNAEFLKDLAIDFLDIAVGIDPLSGLGRSTYEVFSGRNLITGKELSATERSLAFVGVLSLGLSSNGVKTSRLIHKIYEGASHLFKNQELIQSAMRTGEALFEKAGNALHHWNKSFRIKKIIPAEEANSLLKSEFNFPPYLKASWVVFFETTKESHYVRIHAKDNQIGSWLVKKAEVIGLTPQQIADKLNLKYIPTHISEVIVPKETQMSRGMTEFNIWPKTIEKIEGQVQYRLESLIPNGAFKGMKEIGEQFL